MSPEKPPSKRFKQSTISEFFAAPSSRQAKADWLKEEKIGGKEKSGSIKSTDIAESTRSPKFASTAMSYPCLSSLSSSVGSTDVKSESASDEDSQTLREPEQTSMTNASEEEERPIEGASSGKSSTIHGPGVGAAQKELRDPKNFHSESSGSFPPVSLCDSQLSREGAMAPSADSNESRCEIRIFPLDLEQETGDMPDDLVRFPSDVVWKPGDLEDSAEHTVLVETPYVWGNGVPKPSPVQCLDIWDQHHVKMPNSTRSSYNDPNGVQISRWELIERTHLTPVHSFHDFREAVLSYNGGFTWDFDELGDLLEEMSRDERVSFFEQLLPEIVNLALRMPSICTRPPPLLTAGKSHSITMSQLQASCILANAFLSTFPRRNTIKPETQFYNYPGINFHTLFNRCFREKRRSCRKEKIRCILNYFKRVTEKAPEGNITFTRIKLRCGLGWESSQARFQKAFVTSEGLIEDQGYGMLMVDFANRKVGGGVLRDGCVQEETLFVLYPELICARLFTEALEEDEALLVTGVERFNQYKGFSDEFKWTGNVIDLAERDPWGRKYTQMVAIDALAHRGKRQQREQFATDKVIRELVKAFCGFQTPGFPRACLATGNWGCGAFGGDARLKFLIQWMAASRAGRQLAYFTFGNHELMCELRALQGLVTEQNISVGDLFLLLKRYDHLYISNETRDHPSLSEYLFQNFSSQDSD